MYKTGALVSFVLLSEKGEKEKKGGCKFSCSSGNKGYTT